MDNTHKAIAIIIAQDHIKTPDKMYEVLSDLITNDLFALMGDERDISVVDKEKFHLNQLLNQLAFLMSGGIIEHRHAKQILQDAWDMEPYAWDIGWYLTDTKILDETSGNDLDTIILDLLKQNEKVVDDIQKGKKKAAGSLIGPVLKAIGGKANPKEISQRILDLAKIY